MSGCLSAEVTILELGGQNTCKLKFGLAGDVTTTSNCY